MKVTAHNPVPILPHADIRLSPEEASVLYEILQRVGGDRNEGPRVIADRLTEGLQLLGYGTDDFERIWPLYVSQGDVTFLSKDGI